MRYRVLTKIIITVLLLTCLFEMPYSYYELVRFLSTVGFVFLAYENHNREKKNKYIIFIVLAILFQPFLKITLSRDFWVVIDIIIAAWLVLDTIVELKNPLLYILRGFGYLVAGFSILGVISVGIYQGYSANNTINIPAENTYSELPDYSPMKKKLVERNKNTKWLKYISNNVLGVAGFLVFSLLGLALVFVGIHEFKDSFLIYKKLEESDSKKVDEQDNSNL